MIQEYLPVLFQLLLALGIALGGIALAVLLGKRVRRTREKGLPYECGKYPWAVSFRGLLGPAGPGVFWSMAAFVLLLEAGHLYAYKKGVFDWNRR